MSGNLLILNFGTFVETNRFKNRAIDGGFLSTDLMQANPPTGLIERGGMRTKKTGEGTTYSFHGLNSTRWGQSAYRDRFDKWMTKVVSAPVSCVYITGHHGSRYMWWKNQDSIDDAFWVTYKTPGKLVFGYDRKGKQVSITTDSMQKECRLVMGFGCNIGSGANSAHYQKYFRNGSRKPVVLGWNQTVFVPKRNLPSVNNAFFDHLEQFAKTSTKAVAQKDRLDWFYLYEPMELIKAWGNAVAPYRTRGPSAARLWHQARARGADGAYYKFVYDKDRKQAKPVTA